MTHPEPEGRLRYAAGWLQRRAENMVVLLLAVMFAAFIVQIVSRYPLNLPTVGADSHLLAVADPLGCRARGARAGGDPFRHSLRLRAPARARAMAVITALAQIGLYAWSLPAVWDYVAFMKVQRTAHLGIRYDHLYAIYVLFAVAAIARFLWLLGTSLRGRDPEPEPWRGEGEP
jgi:C4-dicarboxylate transporter DctQ subunit